MRTLKWIVVTTLLYYAIVIADILLLGIVPFDIGQLVWIMVVSMPFWYHRVGKFCGTSWFK